MVIVVIGLGFQPAISSFAACPDDIILYLKLDESNPPDAANDNYADFIGDNDGLGAANPTATTGIVNGAQQFDGSADGIDVKVDKSFNWLVDDSFSIEFWVKTNGDVDVTGANQVVIGRDDPTAGDLRWWVGIGGGDDVTVNQNAIAFVLGDNNFTYIILAGTTDVTDNKWHHVVAVRDRRAGTGNQGENRLYVDGELDASGDARYDAGFNAPSGDLNIGYLNLLSRFRFAGAIDEVALYDRALTLAEVQANRDAGLAVRGQFMVRGAFINARQFSAQKAD